MWSWRKVILAGGLVSWTACGSDGSALDAWLPPLPQPDGTPQSVYAGAITSANATELIPGPARTGMVGDFFIRNSKVRFVIESPARVIGIVPWGGNVVDAALVDLPGETNLDQLGEVSLVYLLGRTCAHDKVEVLLDGSGGGPAVIRATGKSAVNDYVNLKGLGYLTVPDEVDPDIGDNVLCATTYVLRPDSPRLEIAWTLYNPDSTAIQGPLGALSDTGGEVSVFAPTLGFSHLQAGFEVLTNPTATPVPYQVFQGPGVAYGLIPRLDDPAKTSSGLVVAGADVLIFGASRFTDVTNRANDYLHLAGGSGVTVKLDLSVGKHGADVDAVYHAGRGEATAGVTGTVTYSPSGAPGAGARVQVYKDLNGNSIIDDTDPVVTYFDTNASGGYTGSLPPGAYLFRADVIDSARSAVQVVNIGALGGNIPALTLPEPGKFHYTITDAANGQTIPVKITVVGTNPFPLDKRFTQTWERRPGVVRMIHAVHGTSNPPGVDPADPQLVLPAGGPYRIYFSRGPEWTLAHVDLAAVTAGQVGTPIALSLRRVVDTTGYVATAFHEHSMGSPDSPVAFLDRVKTLAVEGVEFFASTDHDRLTDYTPYIQQLGLTSIIQSVIGEESTPFAFGHFNAFPLVPDPASPNGGAVDWGESARAGFAMLPDEIWSNLRTHGAKIVQVCHPRNSGFSSFQAYFVRSGLTFDFNARTITGNPLSQEVPNDWLRLPPGMTLFSDRFDTLETWISFGTGDTDGDGYPELQVPDLVIRDWMNFLSMGKIYTPVGNGDTHTLDKDAAGLPRTLVRVTSDTPGAIVADDVWNTLKGVSPRDVVVTDGPFIKVEQAGQPAIGRVIATGGPTTPIVLNVTASSPDWIDFDTIEVFANNTFDPPASSTASTALKPVACYTSRTGTPVNDFCTSAPIQGTLTVTTSNGLRQALLTVSLTAAQIPRRAGATGQDAWIVIRVRGQRGLFPMLMDDAVNTGNLGMLTTGTDPQVSAALLDVGAPAMAFTGPIFVDFDGGGWRAPFAP